MRNFTLRKGFLESNFGTSSSFKGFVMLVVMLIMTASSAMAQEARFFEVIGGLRYLIDAGVKTAALMPKTDGKYFGDIVVPEKVKSSIGAEYSVTSFGDECFIERALFQRRYPRRRKRSQKLHGNVLRELQGAR